ncbi:MAG: NAD(P)H-binding protein [Bacteroidales bacterium]|nr:NAD(P)H-binding protein [Bacteroidales bacterium]
MKIVIIGGTGNYGKKIVRQLLLMEQQVRVVSRNAEKARALLGSEVEVIQGDILNRKTISTALSGMDGVIISLSAMSWKLIRKMRRIEYDAVLNILDEAKKVKIGRLVYLSAYKIRMDVLEELGIPEFGRLKLEVEEKIRESGLNWTILGCAPMFELLFTFLSKGKMMVPGGGYNKVVSISDEDVGLIAAQTVQRMDLGGKRFCLTGPDAYSFPEVAAFISLKTGKEIKHRRIPLAVLKIATAILFPVNPFPRYLYKSLLLLNNFPKDESGRVKEVHQLLLDTFDYQPTSLEMELETRLKENRLIVRK